MEKLVALISDIELAIRYLLSGFAIIAIWLLCRPDPEPEHLITWAQANQVAAFVLTIAVGCVAYIVSASHSGSSLTVLLGGQESPRPALSRFHVLGIRVLGFVTTCRTRPLFAGANRSVCSPRP